MGKPRSKKPVPEWGPSDWVDREKLFDGCIFGAFAMNEIAKLPLTREEMRVKTEKMFFEMAAKLCEPIPSFIGGFKPVVRVIDDGADSDIFDPALTSHKAMKKLGRRRQKGVKWLIRINKKYLSGFL